LFSPFSNTSKNATPCRISPFLYKGTFLHKQILRNLLSKLARNGLLGGIGIFFQVCPYGLVHLAQSLSILSLGIWMIMETKMHIKV
jgi:hypothetical protein